MTYEETLRANVKSLITKHPRKVVLHKLGIGHRTLARVLAGPPKLHPWQTREERRVRREARKSVGKLFAQAGA